MPLDAPVLSLNNVGIAVSGFVALAPLGTALPASLTASLDPSFRQVGYLDDTVVTEIVLTRHAAVFEQHCVARGIDWATIEPEPTD